MSQPAATAMRDFMERHVELWNAGEKEPRLAHQLASCAGGLTMEVSVGTPIERSVDIPIEAWDQAFAERRWKLAIEHLFTDQVLVTNCRCCRCRRPGRRSRP